MLLPCTIEINGYEAFHWVILIIPEGSERRQCKALDATDTSEVDHVTLRLKNPTMDGWFRPRDNVDPELSSKLMGLIVIGDTPREMSYTELRDFFQQRIPLPVKNMHPQQSCVTWVVHAIHEVQEESALYTEVCDM